MHSLKGRIRGRASAVAILVLVLSFPAFADTPFSPAVTVDDIAVDACAIVVGDRTLPCELGIVAAMLGLRAGAGGADAWESTFRDDPELKPGTDVHVVVGLVRPVPVGSIQSDAAVRFAKTTGGDIPPVDAEAWQSPDVPPSQCPPRVTPLPPGTELGAFLLTTHWSRGRAPALPRTSLFRPRFFNYTPLAVVNPESEYTVYPDMGPPRTFSAQSLLRGHGKWQNAGPDKDGHVPRPPITEIHPAWIVLSWRGAVTCSGLTLTGNLEQLKVYAFRGGEHVNPAIAADDDWGLVRHESAGVVRGRDDAQVRIHFPPETTRGIRLKILKTSGGPVAWLTGIHVLGDLGNDPVPTGAVVTESEPFRIPYSLPDDGIVTMAVDDGAGKRVRNVIARREREAGENAEAWDLKDGNGQYVSPGDYETVVLHHPPLELRYEMTPFPNVTNCAPENAPWLTGHHGTGGWLADHTPPMTVCAVGDRVYLGSPCAEGGVAMLEADLDGHKLWGHHNFMAWTGPARMASDGTSVYVHAHQDDIWGVDIATKRTRDVWHVASTSERQRGIRGMTALDGKLYFVVRADSRWLNNAFSAADVDIDHCWPRFAPKSKEDRYGPDLREDFVRMFRLTGTPPGQHGSMVYLESAKGPEARQHVVLATRRPVPVGTLVFPMPRNKEIGIRFSVLKANAPYPPEPENEAQWTKLDTTGLKGWCALTAPAGTETRAIRISFMKGEDDELSDLLGETGDLLGAGGPAWSGQIEGMKVLRRRYAGVLDGVRFRTNSGEVDDDGVWDAQRTKPLSAEDPGIYVLEWDEKKALRGLAVREIDGNETLVDVYTGPDGEAIDIASEENWEQVAVYKQARRYYYQPDPNRNDRARYIDGYVDFGDEYRTRAVRLRIVSQWTVRAEGREGLYGVREDRGGLDLEPARCRVYGILPLRYVGGEPPVDSLISERVEEFDPETKTVVRETRLAHGGDLDVGPSGELFAISGRQIVEVSWDGTHRPVVTDLVKPVCFAIAPDGRFYVFDGGADRRVVCVYSPTGAFERSLGTPGGFVVGPWDPARMGNVTDMDIDERGQLWIVEFQHEPKRVAVWTTDGTFVREHFCRTIYGGGGVLDPGDKSLLYYRSLEFGLDWETGKTRLNALTWHGPTPGGEQPVYVNGRKYLVTRGCFFRQACGFVYLYDPAGCKLVAAVGLADKFPLLRTPQIRALTEGKALSQFQVVWSDLNLDGVAQPDEVQLTPVTIRNVTNFDRQLGLSADDLRFEVRELLPNGVPVYETRPAPAKGRDLYRMMDGNFFAFGEAGAYAPDGTRLWRYPTEGTGVHAYYRAKPLHAEQVVAEFSIIGHGRAHAGDLGEYLVTTSNSGVWHVWTADGLLAARIFRDIRDHQARHWNMQEHDRGMVLPPLTAGQEHFWGSVTQTTDNRYYGIWLSTNVFEIKGMDSFKRINGSVTVTADDIRRAVEHEQSRHEQRVYREAKLLRCFTVPHHIEVNGDPGDWEGVSHLSLDGDQPGADFRMAYDSNNLYLLYETSGMGPFKNSGEDEKRLFKTGACVDLQLATDPDARPDRKGPARGDVRLLIAPMSGKLVAVLYEATVPDARDDEKCRFATMVFSTEFDRVRVLPAVRIKHQSTDRGYVVEASVPLATLGLTPKDGTLLKMDWGVLRTDTDGHRVLWRHYWSNQATAITSDVAAEAALEPALWGHVRFMGTKKSGLDKLMPGDLLDGGGTGDDDVDDLLDELKEELR